MHKFQKYSKLYESFLFKKLFETNIRKDNKLKVHYIVYVSLSLQIDQDMNAESNCRMSRLFEQA